MVPISGLTWLIFFLFETIKSSFGVDKSELNLPLKHDGYFLQLIKLLSRYYKNFADRWLLAGIIVYSLVLL